MKLSEVAQLLVNYLEHHEDMEIMTQDCVTYDSKKHIPLHHDATLVIGIDSACFNHWERVIPLPAEIPTDQQTPV